MSHTAMMLAAFSGLDDWIQIIILVLVFGGSILGGVAKKLIAFFSQNSEDRQTPPQTRQAEGQGRPPRQPARARPVAPAARPPVSATRPSAPTVKPLSPARPAEFGRAMPPVATAWSPKQAAAPKFEPLVPVELEREHRAGVPAPMDLARPPSPPPARPAAPIESVEPPVAEAGVRKRRSRRAAKRAAAFKEKRQASRSSEAPGEVAASVAKHIDPEKHLGRLKTSFSEEKERAPATAATDSLHRPSRKTMRRAVILSEILRPPLALRSKDEFDF